jgi:membrane protein required for colicin V production
VLTLHWLDYAIIFVIGLSVLTGLFRGFVKELIALGIWIFAIWFAYTYCQTVSAWIEVYISDPSLRVVIAFAGIVIATVIAGSLVNVLLGLMVQRSGLTGTDRMLGMAFGFVRGIFIVALLIVVFKLTSIPDTQYRSQSRLYGQFDSLVSWLYGYIPEFIKHAKMLDVSEPSLHTPS